MIRGSRHGRSAPSASQELHLDGGRVDVAHPVDQAAGLRLQPFRDQRMAVSGQGDTEGAGEVQEEVSRGVADPCSKRLRPERWPLPEKGHIAGFDGRKARGPLAVGRLSCQV